MEKFVSGMESKANRSKEAGKTVLQDLARRGLTDEAVVLQQLFRGGGVLQRSGRAGEDEVTLPLTAVDSVVIKPGSLKVGPIFAVTFCLC